MDIYTTTIAISIVIYIAIGNYAGRGVKRLDDYYVAGRRAPTLIIVGTLVASLMSSTLASALLVANGLIMPFLLIAYYVRPYQLATGTLSADGSLDWFAGEAILAMSRSVVYVSLGIFAINVVRNAYSPSSQ